MTPPSVEFPRPRERLGVCSWSLQPNGPRDLADKVERCGLLAVQLALDPLRTGAWNTEETRDVLAERGIQIVSGMMAMAGEDYSTLESIRITGGVRQDETWQANLEAAAGNARVAAALGIPLVTFHAGFIPHDKHDPRRRGMLDRLLKLAVVFQEAGIKVIALETGQESAATLMGVLNEVGPACVGVNFDPANMILYGMGDPLTALRGLMPWIAQVHVKDALPTEVPGTWGREVAVGQGAVPWREFFACLNESGIDVDLAIEREEGGSRLDDIREAASLVRGLCPRLAGEDHG